MRTRVGVLALTAVLSAACGKIKEVNSDGGPGSDAGPEADAAPPDPCVAEDLTFDEAVTCVKTAACGFFSRCLAPFEEGQCDENIPFSFFGDNSSFNQHAIAEAMEAGIIEFHPEELATCLEFFRETSCQEFFGASQEFSDLCPFLSGTVADGGDCVIDFECATPNAVCQEPAECGVDDVCCVRGCVPPSPVDGPCDPSDTTLRCEPGLHCVESGESYFCRTGEDGAPCELFQDDCDLGFWCEDGSCRAEVASGAECYDDTMCPGPETCLGDELDGGELPWVCGRSDREGDPCDSSCSGFDCDQPVPSELGTCVPFLREEGADCSRLSCSLPGWFCDRGADQCVPRVPLGAVCSELATQQCEFGLFCTNEMTDDVGEGVCSGPQEDGASCLVSREAEHCSSGICGGDDPDLLTCLPYPGCYE